MTKYFRFYVFKEKICIGENQNGGKFCFDKDTFIFMNQNISEVSTLNFVKFTGRINLIGVLSKIEYKNLLSCIVCSELVDINTQNKLRQILKPL